MKEEVARDLPAKIRRLHPALMPTEQAEAYDVARLKLAKGGAGAALKMLHHIRAVSVHPAIDADLDADAFVNASARLKRAFEILRRIAQAGERCLVFVEHRRMQFRFIELARAEFGLAQIDLINGDTPISKRQAIVNRFQRHMERDEGFDILVLGPKAAGVGLTLTAATHVIHLSRWWNPAVEEQCNDRTHRIGQTHDVTIHMPMAIHDGYREHSFDCLLQSLMERKRRLAKSALWAMGDTEADITELRKMVEVQRHDAATGDPLCLAITEMFNRDDLGAPKFDSDGSVRIRS
jgi:SNF2 family DNA or RNA helicase